jgi:hypothetical protein
MITITEDKKSIEVHFEGTLHEVTQEVWSILDGYRNNIGDGNMLTFIHGYLEHIEDELKGAN